MWHKLQALPKVCILYSKNDKSGDDDNSVHNTEELALEIDKNIIQKGNSSFNLNFFQIYI